VAAQPVVDVAIIGAGMTGLACAAALLQRGVSVVAYDEAPAGLEGPWATTARMETLRRPEAARRAGARHPVADLPRLVRGAVRAATNGTRSTRSRACNGWTTCAGTAACSRCRC
jgi:cation diffusion facilitator CzcD-associated flavoprotein CzcO